MAKLVISYEPDSRAFVSSIFQGPCNIQVAFKDDLFHNVSVETRLDESLSWVALKSFSGEKSLTGIIKHAAEGQQFRLVTVTNVAPESAIILPLAVASSGGSGSGSGGISEDENVISPEDVETIGTTTAQKIVADAIDEIEGNNQEIQTGGDEPQTGGEEVQTGGEEVQTGGEEPQTEGPQTETSQEGSQTTETEAGGGVDTSGD